MILGLLVWSRNFKLYLILLGFALFCFLIVCQVDSSSTAAVRGCLVFKLL